MESASIISTYAVATNNVILDVLFAKEETLGRLIFICK
jgi:hypothetical protein